MKQRILRFIALLVYVLLACLVLSLKIEDEMTTEAQIRTANATGYDESTITYSSRILFEGESQTDLKLYQVVDGEGWESGLRFQEVPRNAWEIQLLPAGYLGVIMPRVDGRRYVLTASRHPQAGAPAKIIEEFQYVDDLHLALYLPPRALSGELNLPVNAQVLGQTEHTLLLNMTNTTLPFFEHGAKGMSITTDSANRIFSLTEVEAFLRMLPQVVLALTAMGMGLALVVHSVLLSAASRKASPFLWVNGILSGLLLVGSHICMGQFDLPSSMLPAENIFSLGYYREELTSIFSAMEHFPEYAQSLLQAKEQALSASGWTLFLGGLLTVAVIVIESILLTLPARQKSQEVST